MSYLIDTNIISELIKDKPNARVVHGIQRLPTTSLYLSAFTWGELRKGVEKLPPSSKKARLHTWLETDLKTWFKNRILSFDLNVADRWGQLLVEMNRSVPMVDSLIAATALHHNIILLTRNKKDFSYPKLHVINPFEEDIT